MPGTNDAAAQYRQYAGIGEGHVDKASGQKAADKAAEALAVDETDEQTQTKAPAKKTAAKKTAAKKTTKSKAKAK